MIGASNKYTPDLFWFSIQSENLKYARAGGCVNVRSSYSIGCFFLDIINTRGANFWDAGASLSFYDTPQMRSGGMERI